MGKAPACQISEPEPGKEGDPMRLRLQFADRVGMIADVARVVSRYGLNILSLEVIPDNMYLEIEDRPFRGSAS
ncbi:MAG: transcriptional regulator of aroF, aroG, tyrA and aromatic amino acid transport [Moorella sp. (in: firmicutes)]|nr:transcriptional regulator of aroF, aroG, tyrA and aromatic amino acid transport [Moorella sp. (in: firmicutes)]